MQSCGPALTQKNSTNPRGMVHDYRGTMYRIYIEREKERERLCICGSSRQTRHESVTWLGVTRNTGKGFATSISGGKANSRRTQTTKRRPGSRRHRYIGPILCLARKEKKKREEENGHGPTTTKNKKDAIGWCMYTHIHIYIYYIYKHRAKALEGRGFLEGATS